MLPPTWLALLAALQGPSVPGQPQPGIGTGRGPDGLDLQWKAPASCPKQSQIVARVEQRALVRRDESTLRRVVAIAVVTQVADVTPSSLRLDLWIVDGDTTHHRSVEHGDCSTLADAAAHMIGLALEPSAPVVTPDPDPPENAPPREEPSPSATLRASVAVDTGVLPGPAARLGIGGSFGQARWEAGFEIRHRFARRAEVARAGAGANVSSTGGLARGCLRLRSSGGSSSRSAGVWFRPCFGIELSALIATPVGLDEGRSGTVLWVSTPLELELVLRPTPSLGIVVGAFGWFGATRPTISAANDRLFRPARAGFGGILALEFSRPSRKPPGAGN